MKVFSVVLFINLVSGLGVFMAFSPERMRLWHKNGVIATFSGVKSRVQGSIMGWGTGQTAEAVAKTRAVTVALTGDKVKEMNAKGLHREWVERQLKMYRESIARGIGSPAKPNTQIFPRQKLMEKILALWPE
jgi:hypothetical protein